MFSIVRAAAVIALLALVAALPTIGRAQDEPRISNVFVDSDLRQAIEDVAAQAGINIIADPMVQGVVSVELKDVTVPKALELLLAGTGYHFKRTDDYYLVFSGDETGPDFASVAETRRVQIRHIPAEAARNLLPVSLQRYVRVDPDTDVLAVTAPEETLARIMADLAKIDVQSDEETVFISLSYAGASATRNLLPESLRRFVRADDQRNTLAITAPPDTREAILDQVFRIDLPRRPGNIDVPDIYRTQLVKLNNASAAGALALLPPALHDYIRADEETNTLAISAPEILMDGILADVAAIDVPRKHILLNARVVVLERGDSLNFGGEWHWPKISAATVVSDVVSWPWELRFGYTPDRDFTDALSLTLNLLSQNNEATIIASPQVMAQDGKEAEIKVTTEEYFQIVSDAGVYVRSDLNQIETGTILKITPRIGRNNDMTLDMDVEVSDVVARGEQNLPVVSRRTASSTVHIHNGGTAAVAGLVDTRSQLGRSGVPGVGNIPLLGRAFRTDKLNHEARQVAIFVTATVVGADDELASSGRRQPPPRAVASEEDYRDDLAAALDRLDARQ